MDWQPLDFEKPIFELERRLQDLKNHSDAHDVDLDSAVKAVEEKLRQTRRKIYGNLTAWQRVQMRGIRSGHSRWTTSNGALQIGLSCMEIAALPTIEPCLAVWPPWHTALRRHHPPKRSQHKRKCDAQFRLRAS
jgi:Acetyl-CoA carboxylase alpha subunit